MALKLWLPLISDNKNQGISGYTSTGSPTSWGNTSPIGGCATFNNDVSKNISISLSDFNYIDEDFSWSCWLNKNFSAKTAGAMWAFTVGRADAGGRGYGLQVYSTSSIRIVFGSTFWEVTGIPDNEWHHVAFTRNGTAIKIYLDGVLKTTATFSGTLPTYSDGNGFGLGCFHYTSNIYPLIGSICDFRIYNHTFSDKEVHEISNALLLHIPFYGGYSGVNTNIADGTNANNSAWYAPKTINLGQHYSTLDINSNTFFGINVGDTYTFRIKLTAPSTKGVKARIQFYTDNEHRDSVTSAVVIQAGQTGYSYLTSTLTEAQRSYTQMQLLITNHNTSVTSTDPVIVSEVKLELGDKATVWSPAAHSAGGNEDFKIKDCSGYNRQVDSIGHSPIIVSGGPRYDKCGKFTGPEYIYPIADPIKSTTKEFTISCWFYTTKNTNNQCIWNGRTTTGADIGIFLIGSTLRIDDSAETTCGTISMNTWYHLVVTWKSGGNKIVYLNGTQKTSVTAGTLRKSNTYASIGRSSVNTISDANYFVGMMSDFRIYGKVLSAAEVLALYNNPISISNKGELFTTALEEGNDIISYTRTGISKSSNISELPGKYDTTLHFEPDGSCWVRIVHHNAPSSGKFANTDSFRTGVYKDSNRFFDGSICDMVDKWEFMVIQQLTTTDPILKARWIQQINPNVAAFADVPSSAITRILTDGYVSHGFGGLYYKNGSTYWCCNNGASNNWWGAVGAWAEHQGGIPAMQMGGNSGIVKTGFEDLYIRIDNVTWTNSRRSICSFDKGSNGILSTEFIEY